MVIDAPDFPAALKIAQKEFKRKPKTFQEGVHIVCRALEILVISKNKKYGKKNIADLGDLGIFCRIYDKTSRLREHFIEGVDMGKEGLLDTFGDLMGYGAVGVLYHNKNYFLEIKDEKKSRRRKH